MSWQMGAAAFLWAFCVAYFATRFYHLVKDWMGG
jgi:hypothetical protein